MVVVEAVVVEMAVGMMVLHNMIFTVQQLWYKAHVLHIHKSILYSK